MSKVFLIDGSSIFFRAFYAIRDLKRSDGVPTNALYGYISTIQGIMHDHVVQEIVVAFDRPEKLNRENIYPQYKANRKETPDELIQQIPYIKEVTQLMGIPAYEEAGYEADDLIGTMATWLVAKNKEVVIVSGDKDLLQLVNEHVAVLRTTPKGNQLYQEKDVEKRYGVSPKSILDVFALMGDSSDNIPGVPGIGEKTAIALIQEHRSLDRLYQNIDKISGKKRKENLTLYKEQAYLSRQLVTIDTNVPLQLHEESFLRKEVNSADLRAFFLEMELRRFAESITESVKEEVGRDYKTVETLDELKAIVAQIEQHGFCAVDTETTSLRVLDARIVGVSLSIEKKQN
jgi:DNA polymerase I